MNTRPIDRASSLIDNEAGRIRVENPATEQTIAAVPSVNPEEALEALDRICAGAPGWSETSLRARSEILMHAFRLMESRREEIAGLISLENGKSHADAVSEVAYAAEFFRWYAEEAVRLRGELFDSPGGANKVLVTHEPVGPSLLITPWNFPVAMATRKIAPALAAGCTAILKPAAETPLSALAVADILREAGLPDGALEVVVTDESSKVVTALMSDGRLRMLSFTGSTEVGRLLLRQAAANVMKTAMELGGNAPFLVMEDADVTAAVDGAMVAKMRNGGQACTAANRLYVHDELYDSFVSRFVNRMKALRVGDPADPDVDCGPLINSEAVAKVHELVEDAIARGAQVALGGQIPDRIGHFYPPTVLTDVPMDARILHEEVFGPVAPIVRFTDEEDVLRAANGTSHGLVSYLYTKDLARGLRLVGRLESGMIALNRGLVSDPAAPFGGVKHSGLGREGSREGLSEYLETKYVATDW